MIGAASLIATAWRSSTLVPAHVVVVPANFGTEGSHADTRRRRTDVVISPPDPRLPLWNGVLPVLWRRRVVDDGKNSAVAARAQPQYGASVNFTTPRTASLDARLPR